MKKILVVMMMLTVFGCAQKIESKLSYIWIPENSYGLMLKNKYIDSLIAIYDSVKLSGLKVREHGIGITDSSGCKDGWRCEKGKFYVYVIVDFKEVFKLSLKSYEERKMYLVKKYKEDVLYLLRRSKIEDLLNDDKFGGVILDMNWVVRNIKKITKPEYENVKILYLKEELR